jgi:hypothetical protein
LLAAAAEQLPGQQAEVAADSLHLSAAYTGATRVVLRERNQPETL